MAAFRYPPKAAVGIDRQPLSESCLRMAEIINLRQVRKAKARSVAAQQATENRALHGQTKAAKRLQADAEQRVTRLLDGAKREET